MGRYASALDDCNKGRGLDPDDSWSLYIRGLLYDDMGRFADAASDLRAYRAQNPDDNDVAYSLARAEYGLKDYATSLTDDTTYLKTYPDSAIALLLRARIYQQLGKADLARADATASLRQYRIDGNTDGAKDAQSLLDVLSGAVSH
jgi:tetratricopeptide (TPR) repeat protein